MRRGAENRRVGETRLTVESSRSHSVFTLLLERSSRQRSSGLTSVVFSRLNLVDLAGEELRCVCCVCCAVVLFSACTSARA